jgi:protocatechuate 3,4-dioxygenase beta subunit
MLLRDHDTSLAQDFPLLRRRRLMGLVGGTTVATLATAALSGPAGAAAASPSATPITVRRSGVIRSDIRRSFGKASGVARGVPLTVRLLLLRDGRPAAGLAVYLWHADREGRYSHYDPALPTENYLRGIQAADESGWVEFTTVFPGAESGRRRPHLHVEVFRDASDATLASGRLMSSRIALPDDICRRIYTTPGYETSRLNLGRPAPSSGPVASVHGDLATATLVI